MPGFYYAVQYVWFYLRYNKKTQQIIKIILTAIALVVFIGLASGLFE